MNKLKVLTGTVPMSSIGELMTLVIYIFISNCIYWRNNVT